MPKIIVTEKQKEEALNVIERFADHSWLFAFQKNGSFVIRLELLEALDKLLNYHRPEKPTIWNMTQDQIIEDDWAKDETV